jgi:hypothetical protein
VPAPSISASRRSGSGGAARRGLYLAGFALLAVAVAAGCGGGNGGTSPASLSAQLIPASKLRLVKQAEFRWDDPIDFVFEGILVPQSVPGTASKTVNAIDDAGFDAGAGEVAVPKGGGPEIHIDVAKFGSDSDAQDARDYLHTIDLEQPCPGQCDVSPKPGPTYGIPNAKAVIQVPIKGLHPPPGVPVPLKGKPPGAGPPAGGPPPGAGPPLERRVIEFTIGPYLYLADGAAPPGEVSPKRWEQGVKLFYAYERKKTPSS